MLCLWSLIPSYHIITACITHRTQRQWEKMKIKKDVRGANAAAGWAGIRIDTSNGRPDSLTLVDTFTDVVTHGIKADVLVMSWFTFHTRARKRRDSRRRLSFIPLPAASSTATTRDRLIDRCDYINVLVMKSVPRWSHWINHAASLTISGQAFWCKYGQQRWDQTPNY